MTPEEFEKMVQDYAKNGLPEGSALICLHGGKERNFMTIKGGRHELITTIVMFMAEDEDFAKLVRQAFIFKLLSESEKAEAAKTVSDYLDRMGFKKEE